MNRDEYFALWSQLHGEAKISGVVKYWLGFAFSLGRFLRKLRFTANHLTFLAILLSLGVWFSAQSIWSALFLLLSLICDGLDGTLAMLSVRTSQGGAVFDSTADRLTEIFWYLAVYSATHHVILLFIGWLASSVQEYLRSRAATFGHVSGDRISLNERPIRAILLIFLLILGHLSLTLVLPFLWLQAIFAVLGLAQVGHFTYQMTRVKPQSLN
jgi:archaetidylinositol phosphate synthase